MAPDGTPAAPLDDPVERARLVIAACRSLGFALAGVAAAQPSAFAAELREWLANGKHGEMEWLAEAPDVRADPARLLPHARSIVLVADLYARRGGASMPARPVAPVDGTPMGRIARYAQGLDYHAVMKRRLHALTDALRARHPAHAFRAFVDTAPVLEREFAARAGLGFIGKHTLLINPSLGSYLLLGGVLTTLSLGAANADPSRSGQVGSSEPRPSLPPSNHCGSCTRCIDACPTRAITPYSVDARRCISYLTIEHQGPIDPAFHAAMGDWLVGCDVCQDVCPYNHGRAAGAASALEAGGGAEPAIHPAYAPRRASLPVLNVLEWNDEDRAREFSGTALKRVTLDMLRRNARIVLGNHGPRATPPAAC